MDNSTNPEGETENNNQLPIENFDISQISSLFEDSLENQLSKIKHYIKDTMDEIKQEDPEFSDAKIDETIDEAFSSTAVQTQIQTWMSWFWSSNIYLMIIIISFLISSSDARYRPLPIILLIGFPFFLWWAMISSIPEIKIGDQVIFSRKDLTLRKQMSLGWTLTKTFSKEMIKNSPYGVIVLLFFVLLLIIVVISSYF